MEQIYKFTKNTSIDGWPIQLNGSSISKDEVIDYLNMQEKTMMDSLSYISKLKEGLAFYANTSNYHVRPIEDEPSSFWSSEIEEDCGFIARKLLKRCSVRGCGLEPPCPDCGRSLIDFPVGG